MTLDKSLEFSSHSDLTRRNTGWQLDASKWAESRIRREEIENQTERLAVLLEEAGIKARQESDVVAISAVTGIVTEISPWRAIRFLPSVAGRDRRPMLNALRFWLENVAEHPEYMRYGVITSGELVPAFGDLRGSFSDMSRKVSKWAHKARKLYNIEVNFRGNEFTRKTASERDLNGYEPDTVLYHPHVNVLMRPTQYLKEDKWEKFLTWTHQFFGTHWRDCGRIDDVRELVKYVVKPADLLEGEKPLNAPEAKWLHESLFRMNLAQPLGKFKEFYAEMNDNRCKIVLGRDKYGSGKMEMVGRGKRFDHSKDEILENPELAEPEEQKPESTIKGTNIIIGVTLPQWKHSPWSEPMILVQNYDPRAVGKSSLERLREIDSEQMFARQLWDDAGAPEPRIALEIAKQWATKAGANVTAFAQARRAKPYRVHTSSLTVPRNEVTGQVSYLNSPTFPPPESSQDRFKIDPENKNIDFKIPNFRNRKIA